MGQLYQQPPPMSPKSISKTWNRIWKNRKKMDAFCSSSKTPCLVEREVSNNASVEHSAYKRNRKKYEEEQKHREEQRKESESDDVQDLLRMLLVLGDRRYPIRESNLAIF
ncbi:hypothetical protein CDAR_577971 [Caerostris darwini]|uniref:Uncharacterized protein n=1 Tax=Caerostris darwini TaxID=1538125 RepID=A0AAV4Q354_9ARAC|nr:hypothetical protein CDAR_577971 [Caerostris darwini]